MNNAESSTVVSGLAWFKSSYSGTEGGECVEVAPATTLVHVRDSKTATGPMLTVSRAAWTGFIDLAWTKSSHSGTEGGQCVEVAAAPAAVHVRDSKATTGPKLTVSRTAWAGFVGLTWTKSSRSGTEGGDCVEVAAAPAAVHVRDSKATTGPKLTVSRTAWAGFVGAVASPEGRG
ncbi:DUF397 domain-containing protein [Streptomyces sp. PsTaAH-124]|uniref:DUF397 domain-containing protein n=1 Tax=Streptomyces sp. PsTaAH-124 TaxID=1157638 RepID=UPI00035D657F